MSANYDDNIQADEETLRAFARFQKQEREQAAALAERSRPVDYENDPDPRDLSSAAARAALDRGGREEEALGASFEALAAAAARGDRRVRVDLRERANDSY